MLPLKRFQFQPPFPTRTAASESYPHSFAGYPAQYAAGQQQAQHVQQQPQQQQQQQPQQPQAVYNQPGGGAQQYGFATPQVPGQPQQQQQQQQPAYAGVAPSAQVSR